MGETRGSYFIPESDPMDRISNGYPNPRVKLPSLDAPSITSKRHERKKFSKIPLHYPRTSRHTPLLSVPLGKPPTSLHKSIWNVVEFGAQVPSVGDEDYDEDEVAQIEHFNSQATTIHLASLSREEYNKVQGLKSAKEVWDVLKTAHEGDELTKITK
jgi:hypothetical protein